ncbi:uncharacterized protein ACJ7VT_010825 [Polymixia lowei]
METQEEKRRPLTGQLISVNRKDTTRLLEVYIKRSLSLNDGTPMEYRTERKKKWVTMPDRQKKVRRHSSDPSLHLAPCPGDGDLDTFAAVESPINPPETQVAESENKPKKSKKKSSLWKSFLGLFSRKGNDDKEDEPDSSPQMPDVSTSQGAADALPATPGNVRRTKSKIRKFSKRRLSLRRSTKREPRKDITGVESIVSVEPNYTYYEKVSEVMQKIVHEVKEKEEVLTDEEVINRIIALTKQQGDAIDNKLKENPTLSNFFHKMTYTCFQKLADTYLEAETSPTQNDELSVPTTAPELVKLAFTLDFTARVAVLSRQNIGHITGLGSRYLQDRFEYKQVCTDHPWSDSDDIND